MMEDVERETGMIVTRIDYGRSGHPLTQIQPWSNFLIAENYLEDKISPAHLSTSGRLSGRIIVGGYSAGLLPFWLYMTQSERCSISSGIVLLLNSILKVVQNTLNQLPTEELMRFCCIQQLNEELKTLYPDCHISLAFVYQQDADFRAAGLINHALQFIVSGEAQLETATFFDRNMAPKTSLGIEIEEQYLSGAIKIPGKGLQNILTMKSLQVRYELLHDRSLRSSAGFFKGKGAESQEFSSETKQRACCVIS